MNRLFYAICAAALNLAGPVYATPPAEPAAAASQQVQLKIAAQPMREALAALAAQTGLQLIFPSDIAEDLAAPAVEGTYTARAALNLMLANSGLQPDWINARTVAIRSARSDMSSAVSHESLDGRAANNKLLLAQSAETPAAPRETQSANDPAAQEIIVTGTHIRGAGPVGSKMIVLDRQYITESGYGRIEDVLASLPQNFSVLNETNRAVAAGNLNRGSEVQLRGLGTGTTLTLVNGRRQPAGGIQGATTDISSIPTSAIDHIEILTDGASAIYGSDAIGGVVNIILRKDFRGAETGLRMASAGGERNNIQFSQLGALTWKGGNLLAGYQYASHDFLRAADREYSSADGDYRRFGGSDWRALFAQYAAAPGTILCPAGRTDCVSGQPAFAIPAGQDGTGLTPGALIPGGVNYTDNSRVPILPRQTLHAVFANASHNLTEGWEVFIEGRYAEREMKTDGVPVMRNVDVPSTNPFYVNAFGNSAPVRVAYDFARELGSSTTEATTDTYIGSLGSKLQLGNDWQLKVDGSYGREHVSFDWFNNGVIGAAVTAAVNSTNPATALNVFGNGTRNNPATLESIRALPTNNKGISENWYGNVLVEGPLFDLWGGAARMAVGGDFRRDTYRQIRSNLDVKSERDVSAVFAELALPLVGSQNATRGIHALELSLAGRYEDYSDFGTTLDPRIGVNYSPLPALKLRGMWGTSFKAPSFYQADERLNFQQIFAQNMIDPRLPPPGGTTKVLRLFGNNPDLKEETATTWSAGFDLALESLADSLISVTYFNIDYQDKIQMGTPTLELEAIWGPLITRNPTQAQIDQLCTTLPITSGNCTGPIGAILDYRQRNMAVVKTDGVDLDWRSSFNTDFGRWSYGVGGTYTLAFDQAVTETSPVADLLDTLGNPLALRLRGRLAWQLQNWAAGLGVNYTDDYKVSAVDATRVKSWTTVDVNVSYSVGEAIALLDDVTIHFAAVNVFDEVPPFVNRFDPAQGYDNANSSLLGRLVSLQFTKEW